MLGDHITVCFDWHFWTIGCLRDFAADGVTVWLLGPMRLSVLRGEAA